jgi:citrate/tricarballylate utilization protein
MPSSELLQEVDRQLTVCNACRYCEGYCAVFPAMELRRRFETEDLIYMANLCFECRACYYACPYTPPHEYAINLPQVLSELRTETYSEYTAPRLLSRIFLGNQFLVALVIMLCVTFVIGSIVVVQGWEVLFSSATEPGDFYEVIPHVAMVVPAMLLSGWWIVALGIGGVRFWRHMGMKPSEALDNAAFWRATRDAFGLEYQKGGGDGCTYPDEKPTQARRFFHQSLVLGILFAFASTTVAAIYHNFFGQEAPYPYLSPPVMLGNAGGVLMVIGSVGLINLKLKADPEPAFRRMLSIDYAFLMLLFWTAVTGLVLMALRATNAQGLLLALHLGIVAALYLMLPYSKFAHVVYRYAALIRYQVERARTSHAS